MRYGTLRRSSSRSSGSSAVRAGTSTQTSAGVSSRLCHWSPRPVLDGRTVVEEMRDGCGNVPSLVLAQVVRTQAVGYARHPRRRSTRWSSPAVWKATRSGSGVSGS